MLLNILKLAIGITILFYTGQEVIKFLPFFSLDYIKIISGIIIGSFFIFSCVFKSELEKSLDVVIFIVTFVIGCAISFLFGGNFI